MLKLAVYQENLVCLAIYEAHLVDKWHVIVYTHELQLEEQLCNKHKHETAIARRAYT